MIGNILDVLWDIWNTFYDKRTSTDNNSNIINNNNNKNNRNFSKFRSHLKILHSWIVIWSKFHTEGLQILGTTVQNLDSCIKYSPSDITQI